MNVRCVSVAALAAAIGALQGCGSSNGAEATGPVNTGLEQLVTDAESRPANSGAAGQGPDEIRDWLERDAAVLPSLARGEAPSGHTARGGAQPSANPAPTVALDDASPAEQTTSDTTNQPKPVAEQPSSTSVEPTETPAARRTRLARELADSLRLAVSESSAPLREYAALSALELLEPGVAPDPMTIPALTPREIELLAAWRDLFRTADERLASDPGDPAGLADAVESLAESMSQWRTLNVAHAVLCSRVDGFGQFTPFLSPRMLAGRDNAAIVYVEVENFTHRAAMSDSGETGYAVELTQELSLYHDADGLLAWRMPAQTIRDVSRRRRSDFFIVQRIDLPSTLTVGAYRLKITLREEATGAIAETTLPIEMVADAALLRSR